MQRVEVAKQDLWKEWGIYDAIMISTCETPFWIDMLLGFASLWSTSFNGFVLLTMMISYTLLDVMNILGMPSSSEELFIPAYTFPNESRDSDIHYDK